MKKNLFLNGVKKMNKTKTMLTGFAIFASILMLSTTCIAGPVQEKESIDAIEESMDQEISGLLAFFNNYAAQNEQESIAVEEFVNANYNAIQSTIINCEEIQGLTIEECNEHWGGFLRNANGEIYLPGTGWIELDEFWLEIETLLMAIPLEYALTILEEIENNGPEPTCVITCLIILICIEAMIIGSLYLGYFVLEVTYEVLLYLAGYLAGFFLLYGVITVFLLAFIADLLDIIVDLLDALTPWN
jgi:hypothetical protein